MPPLFADLPETIETERLILCCPEPDAGAQVNAGLHASWPELQYWMAWAQGDPPPVEETTERQRVAQAQYLAREEFHFNAFLKSTGEFIAKPSILRIDWKTPCGEIGYWLHSGFVGQGLMTEAAAALTEFGFSELGLVRIEIVCDPLNTRSARIAERLGYTLEGTLRQKTRNPQGVLRDTAIYARVREGAE